MGHGFDLVFIYAKEEGFFLAQTAIENMMDEGRFDLRMIGGLIAVNRRNDMVSPVVRNMESDPVHPREKPE